MITRRKLSVLLPAAAGSVLLHRREATAAANFQGKTISYIVSTKAGGGYDTMGRLVAKYLEKYLPGSDVRVTNVPGGGSVIGALTIFKAAPDGLTIGTFNTGLIYAQLLGELKSPLDLNQFSWIGKAATEARVVVAASSTPFRSIADFRSAGRPIRFASNGKKTGSYYETLMLAKALDFPVEVIPGFEGREAELSMMRGEVDALFTSGSSLEPFVRNGYGRALVQVGGLAAGNVPQASSLIDGVEAKSLIDLIETQSQLARLTAGPPAMDPDMLAALRKAYMDIFTDAGFTGEAARLDLPLAPLSGEEVAATVSKALNQPADLLATLRKLVQA